MCGCIHSLVNRPIHDNVRMYSFVSKQAYTRQCADVFILIDTRVMYYIPIETCLIYVPIPDKIMVIGAG